MEGPERTSRSRRIEPGSRVFSTSAIHLSTAASLMSQQPSKPKGYNCDDNIFDQLTDNHPGLGGLCAPRSNSLENSRNTSTSSSPLTLKGSSGVPPGRPESMSSDDFIPTKEAITLPRDPCTGRTSSPLLGSGNKPEVASSRNSLVSYNNPERRLPRQTQPRPRPRSGSPGSEMVSLEEFLKESNQKMSPPTETSNGRDDLLGDYFKKTSDSSDFGSPIVPASYRDFQSTPQNYVNLSAKLLGDVRDVKPGRPGQYVKPNLRPIDHATNQPASLRRPQMQQPVTTSNQVPEPQHPGSLAARSSSLSRAFSLATADLLKANGSELNRMEKPELETPILKDFSSDILRTSTPTGSPRDRPHSVKISNPPKSDDFRTRSLDTRRLSLAASREDKSLQSSLSTSSLQQPCNFAQASSRGRPRPISRYGEVAMVSPVRPIPSIPEVEGHTAAVNPKPPSVSSDQHPPTTAEEDPNKTSPKSTPASPDPNSDPQTVWYEYGCV